MSKKLLALMILGALVLAGCNQNASEKKGSIEYKNDKSEGSAEVGENVKLPDDFPEDVPVYKNAKIKGTNISKMDNGELMVITMQTDDNLQDIGKFYKDELVKNGFGIENEFETDKSVTLTSRKGSTTVVVSAITQNGKTTIGTNVTIKKEQ